MQRYRPLTDVYGRMYQLVSYPVNGTNIDMQVIKNMRVIVAFFGKSTISTTFLTEMRKAMKIRRGLEAIGKTRFATICISAIALDRCFPAITTLVGSGRLSLVRLSVDKL